MNPVIEKAPPSSPSLKKPSDLPDRKQQKEPYLRCPLCSFEFLRSAEDCHHGCPLSKYCNLITCPSCRYEFPPSAGMLSWWQRLFKSKETKCLTKQPENVLNLTELNAGETGQVVEVSPEKPSRRNTLAVYGLIPGSQFTLLQKKPTYVLRIGETELALEVEIAHDILVKRVF